MKKILINDLLRIPNDEIHNVRLKLNVYDGDTDPKAPETTITLTDFSVLLK